MFSRFTAPTVLCFFLLASSACYADLILLINASNKTFALLGNDTGNPLPLGTTPLIEFAATNLGTGGASDSISFNTDLAYDTSVGSPGNALGYDLRIQSNPGNAGGSILMRFAVSNSGTQTITGLGNFQSYAGLNAAGQARFEASIGKSFDLRGGSGFSSISVTAVPEPGFVVMSGIVLAAFLFIARRQRKNSYSVVTPPLS